MNDCRIKDKRSFIQTESVTDSTIPVEEQMFPPRFGIIGDDFMRSLISFELYATDCHSQKGFVLDIKIHRFIFNGYFFQ